MAWRNAAHGSAIYQRPSILILPCALSCAVLAVLPRIKGKKDDVKNFTRSAPLEAITADGHSFLRFHMGPNNTVVLVDVQNHTATITGAGTEVGANVIIYSIDKVMLSGGVQ